MKIQIATTTAARNAALIAGVEIPATVTLDVAAAGLDEETRRLIAPSRYAAGPHSEDIFDLTHLAKSSFGFDATLVPSVETLPAIVREWSAACEQQAAADAARRAKGEAEEAARKQQAAETRAQVLARLEAGTLFGEFVGSRLRYHLDRVLEDFTREEAPRAWDRAKAAEEEAARKKAAEAAEVEAEKEAFRTEMARWAAEHGSERLRKGLAAEYDMLRCYVEERAAKEHGGFVIDWNDKCTWERRSSPTEEALILAEKHKGEVVWLTTKPDGARTREEAVAVTEFLGRYDLVMPLGDPEGL